MSKTTSSQNAEIPSDSFGASAAESPHVPAPREAAPSWPAESAAPPSPAELSGEHPNPDIVQPSRGGALKASPAPTPPPRSAAATALLFTAVVLLAFIGALWIVAFQKTGDVDPRPFIQQTLIPMLRAKLPMLFGG